MLIRHSVNEINFPVSLKAGFPLILVPFQKCIVIVSLVQQTVWRLYVEGDGTL